jgi:hypothetical protein
LELAKKAVQDLGDTNAVAAVETDKNTESTHRFSDALGFLTGNWKLLVPVATAAGVALLGFTGNLGVLLPLVPVLTAALAGLLAPFTSLAAILVAFVPPLTLIAGLLGGLAAAFFFAGKRALEGGGALSQVSKMVATLGSMFQHTTDILAHDFLPYFLQLGHAAEIALLYFDKLAKMNLGEALKSLSTTGVEMLTHFLDAIGHVIGKPIRLAFEIAFGPQGQQIRNSMLKIWQQIVDFFEKPPSTGGPSIASRISNWFGRQDFTAVGMRWAMELAGAVVGALGAAIKHALASRGGRIIGAAGLGGAGIGAVVGGPLGAAIGAAMGVAIGVALNHYWPRIVKNAESAWKSISTSAVRIFHEITTAIAKAVGPATWHNLARIAVDAWSIIRTAGVTAFRVIVAVGKETWKIFDDLVIKTGLWKVVLGAILIAFQAIVGVVRVVMDVIRFLVEQVSRLNSVVGGPLLGAFNSVLGVVQSIVGAISSAIGYAESLASALSAASLGSSSSTAGRTGMGGNSPGNPVGHVVVVNHFHSVDLTTAAQRRRVAAVMGDEVVRRFQQQAGG